MDLNEYQRKAWTSSLRTMIGGDTLLYPVLGAVSEVAEIAGKIKKAYRDNSGNLSAEDIAALELELGDVLWYVAEICTALGFSLDDVAAANLAKLAGRMERGTIGGSGDER